MRSQNSMKILTATDGRVVAGNAEVARSLMQQLIGLIGGREFSKGSALIIPGCRQVHTFFMRFPIDVLFLDADNRILTVELDVKPYSVTSYCRGAHKSVELPAGTCMECTILPDDILVIRET